MTMPAREVEPGDVLTSPSQGNLMVRQVKHADEGVTLLLSLGRTDPGTWSDLISPEQDLVIYRPPPPDQTWYAVGP